MNTASCAQLFRNASRLQSENRLRDFIAIVEGRALQNGELTPEKTQWLKWANAKADWINPLIRRPGPILDTPEPEALDFWKF